MEIFLDFNDNIAKMKIEGAVTSEDALALQEKLKEVLDTNVNTLQMDLSTCRSMCSSAIGKILYFYRDFQEKKGFFEIVKSSPSIYELFTTIKLNQLFPISI